MGKIMVCGKLNSEKCYGLKNTNGTCVGTSLDCCEYMIPCKTQDERRKTVNMLNAMRKIHQENMELKELLLEIKQNQK